MSLAERIRRNVETMPLEVAGIQLSVTISLGLCIGDPRSPLSAEEIFKRADTALYQAKHGGRNCVRANIPPVQRSSSELSADERDALFG